MPRTIALVLGILSLVSVVQADEVIFKNGDRITGKIDTYDGIKLTMKSGPAAKVDIDLKTVKTFSTDGPINVVLKNGTVIRRRVVLGPDGKISFPPESAPTTIPAATMPVVSTEPIVSVFPFDQIKAINPPPVKWAGSFLLGGTLTTGNSETQSLNASAHLGRRTEKDRITFDASYLYGRQKVPGDRTPRNPEQLDRRREIRLLLHAKAVCVWRCPRRARCDRRHRSPLYAGRWRRVSMDRHSEDEIQY